MTVFLRPKQVAARLGVHVSTVWRYGNSDSTFPKPIKLGVNALAFVEEEVEAWQQRRIGARDSSPTPLKGRQPGASQQAAA